MPTHLHPKDLNTYLDGDPNPALRKRVEAWLQASPSNQEKYFQQLEARERRDLWVDSQTENELAQLLSNLQADDSNSGPQPTIVRSLNRRWWLAAASVAFLLLTAYGFRDQLLYKEYSAGYGQLTRVELTDGSSVELNANSVLRVSRLVRWQAVRRVELAGEGFFSVVHTKDDRPFVVQLPDGTQVDVLGTEFSVSSRREKTKVVLERGSVRLTYTQHQLSRQKMLKPGDWVEVAKAGLVQEGRTTRPEQLTAWRNHQFIFDHTDIGQVALQLTDRFGVPVVIADPAIAERTITGTIEARTADELLTALERLIPVRIDRQEQRITMYAKPLN
ncbi:FecR domain-containing protein [Telluribacter sp.]|jgi:ferric-dicitrate binding protein FerR (iron transport regulator)|uniref:FecR domain-containing protein n=1 Tax=Telluribacter sp. TaxID=1978767 RepID=UPI002E133309|nr:FecR domain-containing protein [Telluribacter sp.]